MIKGWSHLKFWKNTYPELFDRLNKMPDVLPGQVSWFAALQLCSFENTKVVILGQDPYPTRGHAHGLAFSVQPHVRPLPRSLRNLLQEYQDDLGYPAPRNGDLRVWAERGVLLLNTILTVEEGKSLSHAGIGWEKLSVEIITKLNEDSRPKVFMFWGKRAQELNARITNPNHLLLNAPHPSPLATGFNGCKHFSKACEFLKEPKDFWKLS